MLFHVTMRHDAANCAGLHPEIREKAMAAFRDYHATAEKYGVTVKGMYNALPNHVEFLVAEADGPAELAFFLSEATPYEVDFETYAVMPLEQMGEMAERLMS